MRAHAHLSAALTTAALAASALGVPPAHAEAAVGGNVGGDSVSFRPVGDAHVVAERARRRTGDHGVLKVSRRALHRTAYVKFRVSGVPAGAGAVDARLQLTSAGRATAPVKVHIVRNTTWSQQRLSFNRRPAVGRVIGTVRAAAPHTARQVEVSSLVRGNGTYAIALTAARRGGVAAFRSQERARGAPVLKVGWKAPGTGESAESTLFGTNVFRRPGDTFHRALARQRAAYGGLNVVRVFYPGLPAQWPGLAGASGGPVVVSFKATPGDVLAGRHDAYLERWFASVPTDRTVWWTYWHEPEDDIAAGMFSAADYRAAWRHLAALAEEARNPRLKPTLILMCWTLVPGSGREWNDYYAGDSVIDALGWDCYNAGARLGRYRDPERMFSAVAEVSAAVGKPWGIAELGSLLVKADGGARRARWLRDCAVWLRRGGASWVSYFDAPVGGEYRLFDEASRKAWRDVVMGNARGA